MEEMIVRSRTEGFGDEVKLRILLGTYVLRSGFQDQYYIRAQKIRTAIRNGFNSIFETADVLLCPTFPSPAFLHGASGLSPIQQKLADKFTASANMAGIPAISFPAGKAGLLPVGMQLLAPACQETRFFEVFDKLGESLPDLHPEGFSPEPWKE